MNDKVQFDRFAALGIQTTRLATQRRAINIQVRAIDARMTAVNRKIESLQDEFSALHHESWHLEEKVSRFDALLYQRH